MNWKAICFDIDNTLYSHEEAFKKAIEYCYQRNVVTHLNEIGIEPAAFEDWFYVFKKNSDRFWNVFEEGKVDAVTYRRLRYEETMHCFQFPAKHSDADHFHQCYDQIVDTFCEPDEALHPLFQWLKHHKIKSGLISNGKVNIQYRKLEKLGLDRDLIDKNDIVISEEVGFAKPDPMIFHLMTKRLGNKPNECLFVGDTWEHDVVGACRAGWDAVYLNSRKKSPSTNDKPVMECGSLGEVFDWLMDQR